MQYLIESGRILDQIKSLVKSKKNAKIRFNNGETSTVTVVQGEKILETYRELNSSNKVKFIILINSNLVGFNKALTFSTGGA